MSITSASLRITFVTELGLLLHLGDVRVLLSSELLQLAEFLLSLLVLLAQGLELLLAVLAAEVRPVFAIRLENLNIEVAHLLLRHSPSCVLSNHSLFKSAVRHFTRDWSLRF